MLKVPTLVVVAMLLWQLPAAAQSPSEPPAADSSPWTFKLTPYAWLTFMSGQQTVRGRTVNVDTNFVREFSSSESLVPVMGYFEARWRDKISLFVDVLYANMTAGAGGTRNFFPEPGVAGWVAASTALNYETLIVEFGATYEVVKVGPTTTNGVGQTAFDFLMGGRYWLQRADLTLTLGGGVNVNTSDLQFSADGSRAFARSGNVQWVDPVLGFRVRHKLAENQDLSLEADLGGFGMGSRISAQAVGTYAYRFGRSGSVDWSVVLGYRALYVDYSRGSGNDLFRMNILQHGPIIGVNARF
ncbi:MAG: hypothetical protein BGN99_32640 [Alphaproteobacteria bacterium 65-37]|nr:MAG: hypothetical protein BGN99_32640 [Alphaproteobacteria bacterium 65-37]